MSDFKIKLYEDWMRDQVVDLFCAEYGEDREEFALYFQKFYEEEFQKKKCLKVVALDGDIVAGFQSYFYWPFELNDLTYNSYQSGNSLVHVDYRGRGIFKKLLEFINSLIEEEQVSFLIGFPVEASFNSFIRNGWENPFNLKWYVRLVNVFAPISVLLGNKDFSGQAVKESENSDFLYSQFHLSSSADFLAWRKGFQKRNVEIHYYEEGASRIKFDLKYVKRKKLFGELIIGGISSNDLSEDFILKGLKSVFKLARKKKNVLFVSCAVNPFSQTEISKLVRTKLKPINKEVYFIIRRIDDSVADVDFTKLEMFRGDIDTW